MTLWHTLTRSWVWPGAGGLLLCVLTATAWSSASALSSDRDQPIHIEADEAELDDPEGLAVYQGTVVVTQGSIRITADRLEVYFDENNDIQRTVFIGEPARFQQEQDDSADLVRARARTIEYRMEDSLLFLTEQANVSQGGDSVSGDRITYDTVRQRATARKAEGSQGKERVRITITPRNKSTPKPDQ
jgi:lipopolysaccharide export system protein LptA